MKYLIQRRHMVKVGKYFNSPVRPVWSDVGLFRADNAAHAISLAWVATEEPDPVRNLRVAGVCVYLSEE